MATEPSTPRNAGQLLEPSFIRKLEQAAIASRRVLKGRSKGERRSPRKGTSVEFADFRAYTHGDDLRYVDWNAYARLEKLFLKLFVEEEDLHVYVLLDGSESMKYGTPGKFEWAVQAAAALSYLGLSGHDRVQLFAHTGGDATHSRLLRGRGAAREAFEWLAALEPSGPTNIQQAADWMLRVLPTPGVVFVLSDLFDEDWESTLGRLAAAKGDVCVLHTFSPEDYQPNLQGDLRLIDSENADAREITIGTSLMRRYARNRDLFIDAVRRTCHRYGFAHLPAVTSDPVEDVVLRQLRRLQVVR